MAERPTDIPSGTPGPGYARAPAHRIAFVPRHVRVAVAAGGLPIAATTDVVALEGEGLSDALLPGPRRHRHDPAAEDRQDDLLPVQGAGHVLTSSTARAARSATRCGATSRRSARPNSVRDRLAFDASRVDEVVG